MHRRFVIAVAAASFVIALCASACSNQAEGERCNVLDDNNGNDDCADGLQCYAAATLGGVAEADHTDICCPTDRTQSTTSICALAPSPPNSNPGIPDGGSDTSAPASEAGPDSSNDSSNDAPSDVANDVANDSADAQTDSSDSAAD